MTIRDVIRDVCRRHLIRLQDFYELTPNREVKKYRRIVYARHEACYLAYQIPGISLPKIAKVMKIHHTTVLYGIRAHRKRLNSPAALRGHRAREVAYGTNFDGGEWADL